MLHYAIANEPPQYSTRARGLSNATARAGGLRKVSPTLEDWGAPPRRCGMHIAFNTGEPGGILGQEPLAAIKLLSLLHTRDVCVYRACLPGSLSDRFAVGALVRVGRNLSPSRGLKHRVWTERYVA